MRSALLLASLLTLTSCTTMRSIFTPSEVATLEACGTAELAPAIAAIGGKVEASGGIAEPITAAGALEDLAAALPEGVIAVDCSLKSLVAAGEAAAQVDGGALYDLTHLAAMERNLRAFEAKHLKIGMLPVKDGGA